MTNPTRTITETTLDRSTESLVEAITKAADDRQGADITILKVTDITYLADYFMIVTGFSKAQVRAISDAIEAQVEQDCHRAPRRVEGKTEGSWVLHDYGDAIVHIFLPQEREFYNLEAFWGHAERLPSPTDPVGE